VTTSGDVTNDLTENASCQVNADPSENTNAPDARAVAFAARATQRTRSVYVRQVRRYKHGGKVRIALRLNMRALTRAFPGRTRVQVLVGVTIRSARGGVVKLFRNEILLLQAHGPARDSAARVASAGAPTVARAASATHTWVGNDQCNSLTVSVGPGAAPTVTVHWDVSMPSIHHLANGMGSVAGATIAATTTGTHVAKFTDTFTVSGYADGVEYTLSGTVRAGASTPNGTGTMTGSANVTNSPVQYSTGHPPASVSQTS
jgi:hypothetical protein